jgi:hypothetical protein
MTPRLLVALAFGSFSAVAHAQDVAADEVSVEIEGSCVDAAALRFAANVRAAQHESARVAIHVRCGDTIHARIEIVRDGSTYERSLDVEGSETGSLADAIALILAVGLEELARPIEAPAEPPTAQPDARAGRAGRAISTAPAPPSRAADRWSATTSISTLAGLHPEAAIGFAIDGAWRSELGLGVEIGAMAFAPTEIASFEGRISFWSIAGRAAICALAPLLEELAVGGCGGVLAGAISAQASGFRTENHAHWEGFVAIEGRARLVLSLDAVVVALDAILAGAALGPSFYVQRRAERAVAHEVFPVLGGAAIAFGFHFAQ